MLRIIAKLFVIPFILGLISLSLSAQIFDPVKWTYSVERHDDENATLSFTAKIDKGWHIYAQELQSDEGPIATSFSFESSKNYLLSGKVLEEKYITHYDPNFEMDLNYFENKATWRQKIKISTAGAFEVKGELTYMACDEEKCLPPDYINFTFKLDAKKSTSGAVTGESTFTGNAPVGGSLIPSDNAAASGILEPVKWSAKVESLGNNEFALKVEATIEEHWHLYSQNLPSEDGPLPTVFEFEKLTGLELMGKVTESASITSFDPVFEMDLSFFENKATFEQKFKNTGDLKSIKGTVSFMVCDDERCIFPDPFEFDVQLTVVGSEKAEDTAPVGNKDGRSLIGIFILAFLGGFAALLTPCVFPMIPMTVSFFTKQSKTRAKGITNALIYGLSIIIIYVLLGFGVTIVFGADALNALSTNVWFNLAFFVLLVVFAISFFGAFEIVLPSSFINKVDKGADKGGLIGIFFMAFTLALVSFSCTGPIIGTLLVEAAYVGGTSGPLVGMFGFSLALALPFALFAAFPGWLNSLPQSGGWLNSVKVVLGFLELALAFKFLSNADLVVQAGLLTREIFIAIWIAIFGALAAYLFGMFRLPHDSPLQHLSVGRLLFAIVTLIFTVYLIPGMWGAPLKVISGFPPPKFYSESPNGFGVGTSGAAMISESKGDDVTSHGTSTCPHNLNCFHDYEEGLAYAKEVGKPVLLDFTGWACVNCRKMEDQVWSDAGVLNKLRNDVVLISLYVDDKRELPVEEQIEVTIGNKTKKLKTIGNKWSYFQASRYGSNSQPQYILMDHDEQNLVEITAYNPDIQAYSNWLDRGVSNFKEKHQ
jgi:cytochrome c biogenesis protein CcdA/thioredoxin-related protein